jgi:hypothetical protein
MDGKKGVLQVRAPWTCHGLKFGIFDSNAQRESWAQEKNRSRWCLPRICHMVRISSDKLKYLLTSFKRTVDKRILEQIWKHRGR